MQSVKVSSMAALGITLAAVPAAAQMPGNPVYYSPKHGVGLSLQGDYGRGVNDASGKTNYFGARAVLGLPIVTLSAGGGYLDAAEGDVTFGGTAAINLLSAPLLPVAIGVQAGAGYVSQGGTNTISVPIGAVLAVKPPTPALSIEAWAAPRVQITRVSNGTSDTESDFAISAGVNLGLPTGIGLHAAADYTVRSSDVPGVSSSDVSPFVIGVGIHYKFTIPGLGMVM